MEIVYLDDDFNLVAKESATLVKIYDDGKITFARPAPKVYHGDHDQSSHGNWAADAAPVGVRRKGDDKFPRISYSFPKNGDWKATPLKSIKLKDLPKYEGGLFSDGGWLWMADQIKERFAGAAARPGETLVFRLGSAQNAGELANRNGANVEALVEFLSDLDDPEKPGNMYGHGDTITAYSVKIGKTGDYEPLRGAGRRAYHGDHDQSTHGNWADGDVTESASFKKWFGNSKVIDADGEPLVVYHGTTHNIEEFDPAKANPESDWGAGIYFSNSAEDASENYTSEDDPDLSNKIEQLAEEINNETIGGREDWEQLRAEAKERLLGGAPNVAPVYLSMQNPAVLGGEKETVFDFEYEYEDDDPEKDIVGEKGTLVDFIENLRHVAGNYNDGEVDGAISGLIEYGDGLRLSKAVEIIKKSEHFSYYTDDNGRLVSGEIIRAALERSGFDGIIDNTVTQKFGPRVGQANPMWGLNDDTAHYIVFKPEQIKSRFNRKFDPTDKRISYAHRTYHRELTKYERRVNFEKTDDGMTTLARATDRKLRAAIEDIERSVIERVNDMLSGNLSAQTIGNFRIDVGQRFADAVRDFLLDAWRLGKDDGYDEIPEEMQKLVRLIKTFDLKEYHGDHDQESHGNWADGESSDDWQDVARNGTGAEIKAMLAKVGKQPSARHKELFGDVLKDVYIMPDDKVLEFDGEYAEVYDLSDFVYRANLDEAVEKMQERENADFWDNPQTLYHGTQGDNVESIFKTGLEARNKTRGLDNRNVGNAVFTSTDPDYVEWNYGNEASGGKVIEIDAAAMKRDGLTPFTYREPPLVRAEAQDALAAALGNQEFFADREDGLSLETIIIDSSIPAKYIKRISENAQKWEWKVYHGDHDQKSHGNWATGGEPWTQTSEEFYKNNIFVQPGGLSIERGMKIDALPDDAELWVYHATDRKTAEKFLAEGIDPEQKPMNLARWRLENNEEGVEYAPGRGLAGGTYVGGTPQDVSGYGRIILAIRTTKGKLEPTPETEALGNKTGGAALAVNDAQIKGKIGAGDIVMLADGRRPERAHKELVRAALRKGKPVPQRVLDEYPDLKGLRTYAGFEPRQAIEYLTTKALIIKGLLDNELTEDVRQLLLEHLKGGRTLAETIMDMREIFEPWVGDPEKIAPSGQVGIATPPGTKSPDNVLQAYRLENMIRTPLIEAYNQGRLAIGDGMEDYVIGYQYSAILDSRTTEMCEENDGLVIRVDDPRLRKLTPPVHYQCRSMLVYVTVDDVPVEWSSDEELDAAVERIQDGFA